MVPALKAAVIDRGATLIVAHSRPTKMHRYAKQILRFDNGMAAKDIIGSQAISANNEVLKNARNLLRLR